MVSSDFHHEITFFLRSDLVVNISAKRPGVSDEEDYSSAIWSWFDSREEERCGGIIIW